MLKTFTLKNGIKIATYSTPALRSLYLGLNVKSGSIFYSKKTAGVAHFMEHILLQGTPSFPTWLDLSTYIESLAGNYNAYTKTQSIKFFINAPVTKLEDVLRVGSEVFYQPLFLSEAVEKERGAIVQEMSQRQDSLNNKLGEFFASVRYKTEHPFTITAADEIRVVTKVKKETLKSFWSEYFFPKNTYLVLVGGFEDSKVRDLINKYFKVFSNSKKFKGFPNLSNEDFSPGGIFIREDRELKSCYVDFSFPSMNESTPLKLRVAQSMIKYILTSLTSSRLYKLLRHQKGLVYGVFSGSSTFPGFGSFYISTETTPENLVEVVDIIAKELVQIISYGPTKEELEFVKNYSINRNLMSWDHPSSIADWISDDLMWEEKVMTPEEYVELVKEVSLEDVSEVIKFWDLSKLILVIQGPVEKSKAAEQKFAKLVENLR